MGWGKEAAARLKGQEDRNKEALAQDLKDQGKIAMSAEDLWQQLINQLEIDVKEFNDHSQKKVDFRAYSVNPNYFVVERPVQPTAKLEFVRTVGQEIRIDFSAYTFSGFTGVGTEMRGRQRVLGFGLDAQKTPCFIDEGGVPLRPADISAQAGALLEKFTAEYL